MKSKTWESQVVKPGTNLLTDTKSKKFELIAEFDLNGSKASKFGFRIANKTLAYHVKSQSFLDEELKPGVDGRIKIHILADWGQLEVFANRGVFSWSEQFAFSPENSDLSLFCDEDIKLVSMEFHELSSIW
jgi:levanase/fructan beta-fructosidase